jgi:hypothetical protein
VADDSHSRYSTLNKKGITKRICAENDLSTVRPLSEAEIRIAITDLNVSTALIEKQNKTLRTQKEGLDAIIDDKKIIQASQKRTAEKRKGKYGLEKDHVALAVEELTQNITSQLDTAKQQIRSSNASLPTALAENLNGDDRLLSRLQSLAANSSTTDEEDLKVIERVEALSKKLSQLNADFIRTRLDRVYLENTLPQDTKDRSDDDQDEETEAIRQDLDSLYSEIPSVVEMAIQEDLVNPILHAIEQKSTSSNKRALDNLQHVSNNLQYLVNKLNLMTTRIRSYHAYSQAIHSLDVAATGEIEQASETQLPTPPSPSPQINSPRRRKSSGSPEWARRPSHARRRSSGALLDEKASPEAQLIQRFLGTPWPSDLSAAEAESFMIKSVAEQETKMQMLVTSLDSATDSALAGYLGGADRAAQLLRDSLLVDSPYLKVNLVDSGIATGVDELDERVAELAKGMTNLDLAALQEDSKKRDKFVERWE